MIDVTLGSAYHQGSCSACSGGRAEVVTCMRFGDPSAGGAIVVRVCAVCRSDLMAKLLKLTKPTRRERVKR